MSRGTRVIIAIVLGSAMSGCGGSPAASTGPAPLAPAMVRAGQTADSVAYPLLLGSFSIANDRGDGISGTYEGTASVGNGSQTSTLTVLVSSGTGAFAGASGSLTLSGSGGAVDEGRFTISGGGDVILHGGVRIELSISVRGTSTLECSTAERIIVRQQGDGTMRRTGRVRSQFSHEVGNTGCSS